MSSVYDFRPGDRVRVSLECPIDFEGVGPLPGDSGQVVELSDTDHMATTACVHFERVEAAWNIPHRFLERVHREEEIAPGLFKAL